MPEKDVAERAVHWLGERFPQAKWITAQTTEHVEFFHGHANWGGVLCPACGTEADGWWNDAMTEAHKEHFESLDVTAACCKAGVSLNNMRYRWPATFGRFSLRAENPDCPGLEPEQLVELVSLLGCKVREVIAHI